jgi:hypothetical protein
MGKIQPKHVYASQQKLFQNFGRIRGWANGGYNFCSFEGSGKHFRSQVYSTLTIPHGVGDRPVKRYWLDTEILVVELDELLMLPWELPPEVVLPSIVTLPDVAVWLDEFWTEMLVLDEDVLFEVEVQVTVLVEPGPVEVMLTVAGQGDAEGVGLEVGLGELTGVVVAVKPLPVMVAVEDTAAKVTPEAIATIPAAKTIALTRYRPSSRLE